ncbi:MAG TPA: hypothetical protein VH722_11385 [Alphaproteobacteria bacterium]|jgi:hypothetical protein|nr:hypothetical protein [Alphaproteobacteria bacterium]
MRMWRLAILMMLSACAPHVATIGRAAAIKAAWKACDDSWGAYGRRQFGAEAQPFDPSGWYAELAGDHWHVWTGSRELPGYEVDVPLDGRPLVPDETCGMNFQD